MRDTSRRKLASRAGVELQNPGPPPSMPFSIAARSRAFQSPGARSRPFTHVRSSSPSSLLQSGIARDEVEEAAHFQREKLAARINREQSAGEKQLLGQHAFQSARGEIAGNQPL